MAGMDPATFGAIEPTGWLLQTTPISWLEKTYMFAGQTRIFVDKTGIFSG